MLQGGDIVRFSNDYLREVGRRGRHFRKLRGKQRVAKVVRVVHPARTTWFHGMATTIPACVELDVMEPGWDGVMRNVMIATSWLRLLHRPRRA